MLEGFYLGVPSIREQSLMNWFLVLFIRIKKQTNYKNQKANKGTRSISHPLIVDLVNHTLTVPKHVIGYTLILESENGETCTYIITDTVFILPQELSGHYQLSISNDSIMYKGSIYVN